MVFHYKKLGELVAIVGGGTPDRRKPHFWNGDINWISVKDLVDDSISSSLETITREGLEKSSAKLIPKGNIILPTRMALGKVAINQIDVAINQDLKALIIKDNSQLDLYYLFYFLKSKSSFIESKGKGATVKGITVSLISDLQIPLPPLTLQKKIASALGKAQELINKRKAQIEALDQLTQSVFLEMFGDPVKNNKNWVMQKLSETGELKRGISKYRPRNAPELLNGPYPLIQTGDVANSGIFIKKYNQTYSELGLKQSKMWPKGTLCITIAANIAQTGILTFDACFPDSVVAYIPKNYMSNIYVHFWFTFLQRIIEANAPESAQKNINLKILSELEIPVPPVELQNKFVEIVEKIESQKDLLQKSLEELENNFNSLMQRAFKGELFND
ncbi:restriction endonuclease [Geobacillus subterraneus]|uniref:Restriction endonuclease n=2 Tax=Geobacillus TaxID=129337 RepID=A0ABM6AE04_9BACL|nr:MULTISPECIES: restriction endonuclease subunit S [Geobacillus]AMX84579.1 restriction endonuclease [Geobacillus subterraneus]KZS24855.1 restriction endonuclease [Geobacillus subterraneus]OXB85700.1 restriction endonuclease [Geobacillus uzenensis]